MKRIVIALAAAVVLLCGCTKMPTSEYCLSKCFVTDATITVGETEYGAALSRFADGYWLVELTSPAAVKGLIFTVSGENTEVSFDGLKFTFDTARFPAGSVVSEAIGHIDRLASETLTVINGDEQCLASGEIDGESYTLTLSKTLVPQKLELDGCGMCITFEGFEEVE